MRFSFPVSAAEMCFLLKVEKQRSALCVPYRKTRSAYWNDVTYFPADLMNAFVRDAHE